MLALCAGHFRCKVTTFILYTQILVNKILFFVTILFLGYINQAGWIEYQSLPACGVLRKKFSHAEDCAESLL